MKNRLPFLFALCLLAGLFSEKISAQNFQVYIVGNEAICSGQCTDLTVIVTGASGTNLSFLWSGPAGFGSTQQSIVVCQPGTYTVRVLGNNGAVAWAEFVVYAISGPQLLIFSDNKAPCNDSLSGGQPACEKVCPYSTVTYNVIDGTGAFTWVNDWSIFGAQSYTIDQQNNTATITWGGPGTGSLTVFSGDSLGCPGEATKCVTIIEPPQAEIGAAPAVQNGVIKICKGGTVYFENQSQDADYFEWDFGNGQTSLLANPTITFNQPGTFTARLIASSACLCSDTTEVQIQVESGDAPSLDCVGTICAGETVTYTSSTSCGGYIWQVSPNGQVIGGGGLTDNNITIQWTDGPLGTIQLGTLACVGNVCPEPAIVQVPIIADNAEIKGTARVCPSAEEVYSIEPFSGTNFVWTVASGGYITSGQGTHEIKVQWTSPANVNTTHWLSVEYTNCYLGCSGRDSLAVKILSPFFITGPVEVCEDGEELFSAKLSSNNSPFSCQWSLTAPAGGNTWNSASASTSSLIPFADGDGSYRILATPADPSRTCTDKAEWALTAKAKPAKPTAILGETTICPGQIYEYEADGVSPGNNVVWQAQNGGPATSSTENATTLRTWGAANPRWLSAAQITADDLACRSDTVRVNIADLPPLSMSGKPLVCIGEVANYAVQNFQNIDYQWQITPSDAGVFAEGTGTGAVEVFWQKPGTHTLRVTVCGKTATQNITVVDVPAPDVQHPAGLCPNFVDAVMTTVPTYSTWTWLDETGAVVSTDAVPDLGPGTYAVEVRDANGCPAKTEFTIDEFPSPNLSVTTPDPTGFCNNSVFVTMSALVTADGDYTYNWFKDNVPLGVNTPTYTTNQYGKYTVNVVNQFGCPAKDGPITLFEYCGGGVCHNPSHPQTCPPGTVDIAVDPATVCNTFQFHNSSGPLYQPGTAQWAFGESGGIALGTSFDENPLFMFPNAGHYIVVLYATATNGAVCKDLDSVRVRAVSRFEATPGCPGFPTVFKDISTFLPGESIAGWAWDFGDPASGANNISTAQNPSHTFAAPGDYSVSLTVSMVSGCTATWSLTVKVPPAPTTNFTPPAAACAGNALEFNAASDVTEITWNFADPASGAGNSAKVTPAYHTFSAPGNYPVAVTAKNVFGCESSFSQPVTVHPNTLAGSISMFPNSPLCEGKTTMLTAPAGAASYKWSDGSTASTLVVGNEGKYTVTLTNAQGCTFAPPPAAVEILPAPDALVKAILKNDLGQIVGTAYPSLTICAGEDVFLNGIGGVGSGAVFSWSGGGTGKTLEFSADKFNQLPVGSHTFTVTVTATTTGCTAASPPFPVQVNPNPANIFISSAQWPPCAGTSNTLTYSGSQPAGTQFIWNTGHIGTTLTTTNPGQYFLRVQNQFGCSAESNRVAVLPGPNRAAIPSGCHTRCRPDTLCLPALPGVSAWQWLLNGTPIPGANSPNFIATNPGAYTLQMTDFLGCTATSDPLVLDLYDGYGTVAGQVWADVNGNGQIDPNVDTLVAGIPVLLSENGTTVGNSQSNASGDFAFANILSTNYSVSLDLPNLPAGWTVVIGQQNIALSGCDDLEKAGLLLTSSNCPPSFGSLQLSACAGDFATYNGEPIAAGNSKIFTLTSAAGCDSLLTVNVSAILPTAGSLQLAACAGDFATYNGDPIPAGGSKIFNLTSAAGCDSLLTVNVSAILPTAGSLQLSACAGDFATYNGDPIPAGGSKIFNLTSAAGCDSLLTVSVSAILPTAGSLQLAACAGDFATYNSEPIPAGGSKIFNLTSAAGCDSLLTVSVSAILPTAGSLQLSACAGDFATYNGDQIPAGGSKVFNLTSAAGCDSLLTVNVSAILPTAGSLQLSACAGDFATYNGDQIPAGGSKVFNLTSTAGCDSLLTVNVSELQPTTGSLQLKACAGDFATYNGDQITAGDSKVFTLPNVAGCDSLLTVSVLAAPVFAEEKSVSVCPGEPYLYDGVAMAAGETRVFEHQSIEGCDSTVTVRVEAFPAVSFGLAAENSCPNLATGSLAAVNLAGGAAPFQYSIDGVSFQDSAFFRDLPAGNFTLTVQDANDCLFEQDTVLTASEKLELLLPGGILPCDSAGVVLAPVLAGDTTGLTFKWATGAQTPVIQVFEPGKIWLEATNRCETVRQEAEVAWSDSTGISSFVFVPNAFSPNARTDGNELFRGFPARGVTVLEYELSVYDRWGEQVFLTRDLHDGWRGPLRDRVMNPEVFVWLLEMKVAVCGRVVEVKRKGDVTIVN